MLGRNDRASVPARHLGQFRRALALQLFVPGPRARGGDHGQILVVLGRKIADEVNHVFLSPQRIRENGVQRVRSGAGIALEEGAGAP